MKKALLSARTIKLVCLVAVLVYLAWIYTTSKDAMLDLIYIMKNLIWFG
ncbi:hypothetical protein [Caudoviricetes sp.]|nr:hypothetical protein [Caudoviricetes sp.]